MTLHHATRHRPTVSLAWLTALLVMIGAAPLRADTPLHGRWMLNEALTAEAQPDGPKRGRTSSNLPQASVSVGGMPLPRSGNALPTVAGNPQDPKVLRSAELIIEPLGDDLQLRFTSLGTETLKRGNDQGLVSRWSARKLTTRYETTSRKVSQVYEVRRDGHLLVTVKLNPNQGPSVTHKRVFERVSEP
jgi:hypothetical protein